MKITTLAFLSLSLVSGLSQAGTVSDFFSGITVGGGYATDTANGETLNGYSVYSQGYIVPSMKDNLFTDFRSTSTSKDGYTSYNQNTQTLNKGSLDLERYQAQVGYDVPLQVSGSVVVKPYVAGGWSFDKLSGSGHNEHKNSFVASAGVKGEFGKHIMTGVGYSKENNGFKSGQWMADVGYRF